MSTAGFAESVAARCAPPRDVENVERILKVHRIVPDPAPPVAHRLQVRRIAFSGEKVRHGVHSTIDFKKDNLDDGLWIIASEDNFVGKSSTLQIILWALRGDAKSLAKDVQHWLRHVEVDFIADSRRVSVAFDVDNAVPSGSVTIEGEGEPQRFGNGASFKRIMQDVMLRLLGFDPIPATRKTANEEVIYYEDGWAAYTGAFLSDPKSNSIIGEDIPGTNLTQRLLQVFLGIPWATTHFQARAARNVLENEIAQQKRRLASVGGRTVDGLQQEISAISATIADRAARDAAIANTTNMQLRLDNLQERLSKARMDHSEFEGLVEERQQGVLRAERAVMDANEEATSTLFFKQLNPVECPRCSIKITDERRTRETTEHRCAVCTTVSESGANSSAGDIEDAEESLETARRQLVDAQEARSAVKQNLDLLNAERTEVASALSQLSKLGTAIDVQMLERQRERLLGMLDIVTSVLGERTENDEALLVVTAAESEAEARTKQAADTVLDKASKEITRIVRAIGATQFDSVQLDRAARCKVEKGGVFTYFSNLTDGEQLRLRISTILALMHTARTNNTGRHPGFLIIDSPGAADSKQENVAEAIREIAAVINDLQDIQVFVAMRNVELAKSVAPKPERVICAADGETIW